MTETRLRFHPLTNPRFQPFIGFYKDPLTNGPTAGLLVNIDEGGHFQLLAEERLLYGEHINAFGEGRFGAIFGDWRQFKYRWFLETYGESILIPRLESTPVSTLWTRLGWRQSLTHGFFLDPFVQLWTRASVSLDLGEPGTELRPGARLLFIHKNNLSLSAAAYRRLTVAPIKDKFWEGLFVIQGEL